MPEEQASPSLSRPPSTHENDHQQSQSTPRGAVSICLLNFYSCSLRVVDDVPAAESSKRTYLSLLPPPQLIDLILAIDANRQTVIFPHDLESAIRALQRPHRQSQSPSPNTTATVAIVVKDEAVPSSIPPAASPPAQKPVPPPQPPPIVAPPQYRPAAFKQPPHPHMYPYTHTPYYPPPQTPPSQVQTPAPPARPPAAPTRHPLFTSVPLTRDPNKPPVARPTPPPAANSRDDPNAMPSYEEMIVEAIVDVGDGEGTAPKILFAWMAS